MENELLYYVHYIGYIKMDELLYCVYPKAQNDGQCKKIHEYNVQTAILM